MMTMEDYRYLLYRLDRYEVPEEAKGIYDKAMAGEELTEKEEMTMKGIIDKKRFKDMLIEKRRKESLKQQEDYYMR